MPEPSGPDVQPSAEGRGHGRPAAAPLAPFLAARVQPGEAHLSLGQWVRRRLQLSATLYRRLKARGGFLVNGRSAAVYARLHPGDEVALALPAEPSAAPEPMPLAVVFEDEHLLVVDKPSGMVMHPARGHDSATLVNGLAYYRLTRGEPPWVHPVHRLDRGTSGLVLVAKNPYAHERLVRQRRFGRSYVAILRGHLARSSGRIDLPIRDPDEPEGPARTVAPGGRPAATRFRVVARGRMAGEPVTLVVVRLRTGRTHQIRLHMASIGHPVWGDPVYGPGQSPGGGRGDGLGDGPAPRLMLHARKLWFLHPITGRRHVLRSPPEFLESLQRRAQGPAGGGEARAEGARPGRAADPTLELASWRWSPRGPM